MEGHCKNWSIARVAGEAIMRVVGEGVVRAAGDGVVKVCVYEKITRA